MNELAMTIVMLTIANRLLQFLLHSGCLLFFHQVPQVEMESGAEGEEEIGDPQELLRIILSSINCGLKKNLHAISFLLQHSWTLHYCIH